jgi:hypothetical protein
MNKEQLQVLLMESLVSLKTQGMKYPSADPHHSHNIHCQLQNQPPAKDKLPVPHRLHRL